MTILAAIRREERKLEKQLGKLNHQLSGVRAAAKALGGSANRAAATFKIRRFHDSRLLTDARPSEPCTATRSRNTHPHTRSLFGLSWIFGTLRFAAGPCSGLATSRSISPRRGSKLGDKRQYPLIQHPCGTVYRARRLRFSHAIDAALHVLRVDAHFSKHFDSEALVATFIQTLQTARQSLNFSCRGVHASGCLLATRNLPSGCSWIRLCQAKSHLQCVLLGGKESQFSVQDSEAAEWLFASRRGVLRHLFRQSD